MRSITAYTGCLKDGKALRREMSKHGYLFLPGLIPADEVNMVARQVAQVLMRFGIVDDESGYINGKRNQFLVDGKITDPVYADLQALEDLHRLVCNSQVQHVIFGLLGESFVHPQRIIRTTIPVGHGGPGCPAVHRDYPTWRVSDMITVWCPLSPCPPERGAICILEGSHRAGLYHPYDLNDSNWKTSSYEPGDVLLMHCYTAHGALPNETNCARFSVDSRWQRLSDPAPHWSAMPDRGKKWDWYTRGWAHKKWVLVPETATLVTDEVEWRPLKRLPQSVILGDSE